MRLLLRMRVIRAALWTKRPLDARKPAALPAHHLGKHVVVFDVNRIGRDLGGRMTIADMPGDAQQAQRIVSPYLEQFLRRRFHKYEAIIVETQRIAVVEHGCLIEIEQHGRAVVRRQGDATTMARLVVERHAVGDTIGFDGRAADKGRCTDQNRKYRCAIGKTFAGSHTSNSPSAVTA